MKKLFLLLAFGPLFLFQTLAQKTVYFLNEKMAVGCYGANQMSDFTKKVTVTFDSEKTNLFFSSVNCKKSEDCTNYGVVNATTGGVLYLNSDNDLGFISEKNEKIIVLRKKGEQVEIIGVAHSDKDKAEGLSIANENEVYKNELANFKTMLERMRSSAKMQKMNEFAKKDSASTFLDSKEILKDSRGMSGIYYSTFPIKVEFSLANETSPNPYVKKFLINYDEKAKSPLITINTQYAYETTDRAKFVKCATFWLDSYWKNVLDKKGVFATGEADNVDNRKYEYTTHSESKDLQGNSIYGKDWQTNFDGVIYEAEPGILLLTGDFQNFTDFEKAKKYGVVVVLYKAEKATQAAKYTNDVAWDKVKELSQKIEAAGNVTTATLPTETFKDAQITSETTTFAKQEAAKNHPNEQVQYTYIAGNDWNIVRDKTSGAIVKRTLRIIVVVKIGTQCAFENASITQTYDGSNYGRSVWGGTGAPVYFDCKQLNLYK
jgi:hypothetical protein